MCVSFTINVTTYLEEIRRIQRLTHFSNIGIVNYLTILLGSQVGGKLLDLALYLYKPQR